MSRAHLLVLAFAVAGCGSVPSTTSTPPAVPAAGAASTPLDASLERRTLEHVEKMRAIKPAVDARQAAEYNRQLEEAWKFFIANPEVNAVLRRVLARELTLLKARNDFLLLDLGYYLHEHGTPADREFARSALFTFETKAEIIRFNQQELFQFTQSVAASRDARILPFIDRVFLLEQVAVGFPEFKLTLDPNTACAFLYGAYGDGAEAHLRARLKTPVADRALARKVLDILGWVGSPSSNQDVKNVLIGASHDYETFTRTASFLLNVGGPQGRSIVLAVQPEGLDLWTRNYYDKIYPSARALTYTRLSAPLLETPSAKAVLDSERPHAELIAELMRKRTKLFRAVSPDGILEIQRTNALLNALRYRDP